MASNQEPEEIEEKGFPLSWGQILALIGAILLVIFIAQNTEEGNIDFLFWTWTVSTWVALAAAAIVGFLVGWLVRGNRAKRKD